MVTDGITRIMYLLLNVCGEISAIVVEKNGKNLTLREVINIILTRVAYRLEEAREFIINEKQIV